MGQLTNGDTIFMVVTIVLGLIFFAAVCASIYFFFKRLARQDQAENEHFSEEKNDIGNH